MKNEDVTTEVLDVNVEESELAEPLENERVMLTKVSSLTTEEFDQKLKDMDKAFKMLEKMQDFCLKHINTPDVVDMDGNPFVQESGLSKFRMPFGIYEKDIKKTIVYTDGSSRLSTDKLAMQGEFDYVLISGTIGSSTFGVETMVSGGVKLKDFNENWDDDKGFWLKKAEANWKRRAFEDLLGVKRLTWEDLPKVTRIKCVKITHGKTAKADYEQADQVWNNLLQVNEGNMQAAEAMCLELTTFKTKEGKTVQGKFCLSMESFLEAPTVANCWNIRQYYQMQFFQKIKKDTFYITRHCASKRRKLCSTEK
jgi:hypothetical protein